MTEFDELCKEAEDIDFETRCAILRGKSEELLPLLSEEAKMERAGLIFSPPSFSLQWLQTADYRRRSMISCILFFHLFLEIR